jgi:23S rRNA pseudouridine1911/1915/1917 synthase
MNTPKTIYEDNHLLVLDKPNNWLVQGDQTGDESLTSWATEYLRVKYNKPGRVFCHPCHRLDRPVGGVVIFARTSKALERMNALFREGEVAKTYLALVMGTPAEPEGTLVHWIEKDAKRNTVNAYDRQKGKSKRAELRYALLAALGQHALLKIHPKTGRPHQIRAQMRKLNCPIRGDLKYGYPKPNPAKSISLHCFQMTFVHPVKKEKMTFTSRPDWPSFKDFIA